MASAHNFNRVSEPIFRSGYGNVDYRAGTAYYALCTCRRWFSLRDGSDAAYSEALQKHRTDEEANERGFDRSGEYFVCRFDRTVADDMDAHDRVCTGRDKR